MKFPQFYIKYLVIHALSFIGLPAISLPSAYAHSAHARHERSYSAPASNQASITPAVNYTPDSIPPEECIPERVESISIAHETFDEKLKLHSIINEIRFFKDSHDECCGKCKNLIFEATFAINNKSDDRPAIVPECSVNIRPDQIQGSPHIILVDLFHPPRVTTYLKYRVLLI